MDSGDVNGACNRAYYAMFDAARAALSAIQEPPESEAIKTHSGLVSAFSLHLVKTGHVSVELGKSLSKVADIRPLAPARFHDPALVALPIAVFFRMALIVLFFAFRQPNR